MKFSLINVYQQIGNRVSGAWLQDHHGTIESATLAATRTANVNGNKINVAVVDLLGWACPGQMFYNRPRLN